MADVVIDIEVSSVSYSAWLRTSFIGLSTVSEDGTPMIEQTELGPDNEVVFSEFIKEASREVAKIFVSRQGDAVGTPFEYDGTDVVYRFLETEPVLPQASAIKNILNEDVKNALYAFVTYLWFKMKINNEQVTALMSKFQRLTTDIQGNIYRLHD